MRATIDIDDKLIEEAKKHFSRIHLVKPEASTKGSKEFYLVAQNFRQMDKWAE